jgi:hypothetical protein
MKRAIRMTECKHERGFVASNDAGPKTCSLCGRMELLPDEIRKGIPRLYATDGVEADAKTVHVKFFDPCGSWTWYAVEGEPVFDAEGKEIDFEFFGLVHGFEKEWGYFRLSEIESVDGPFGIGIERDHWFGTRKIGEIK